ncbi:hypothetical protein J2W91_004767 [Paenibacillus amylolyticus]|uniref:Uncharacterized protein n=1 Tax=Paenibacillus amylolyticus TaxID=1451 RepID=A0AAP5H984_PAEAM|nr:hypothetical protein [Paenibacillus amylolyticus]MDR6726256.1 hypothetical protein [Paenibacillus amylolyticus]
MSSIQLSIPVGLLVENVLTSGDSPDDIIQCLRQRDYSQLLPKLKEPTMNLDERLQTAAEVGEDWETAIRLGYEFKFLHINGLKRLLDFRFDQKVERDYVQENLSLHQVQLHTHEVELLRSMISRQWDVVLEEKDEQSEQSTSPIMVSIQLKYQ